MRSLFVFMAYASRAFIQIALLYLFARRSGAEGAGQLASALAISAPIFTICEMGLRSHFHSADHRPPFASYFAVRVTAASVAAILTLILVWSTGWVPLVLGLAIAFQKLTASCLEFIDAYLMAEGRVLRAGSAIMANSIALLPIIAVVLWFELPPTLAVVASGGTALVTALVLLSTQLPRGWMQRPSRAGVTVILAETWTLGVGQSLVSLLSYSPVLYLTAGGSTSDAGIFGAAQYWVTTANMVFVSLQQLALPRLHRLPRATSQFADARKREQLRVLVTGTCIAAIATAILSPVNTTIFGSEFYVRPTHAAIIGAAIVFVSIEYALLLTHFTEQSYKAQAIYTSGALILVALAWVFMPPTSPPLEAAFALMLAATGGRAICSTASVPILARWKRRK